VVGAVTRDQVARIGALFPDTRAVWTPNGIDLEGWHLRDQDRARGRAFRSEEARRIAAAQADIDAGADTDADGKTWLGFFGQLKAKKGTLFFLEALAASGRLRDTHLVMVGDVEEPVRAWLAGAAAAPAHTLLPFRDRYDLLPMYAAVDLIVLPSFYDGMPNVLLEAAALGVPVLGSDAGAMPDVLGAEWPLSFAAGDHHACARVIARALDARPAERTRLGQAARQRVVADLDARAETQRYLDIFAETMV
jgi:glycosyltransferase involved in cell wall biosynthesis